MLLAHPFVSVTDEEICITMTLKRIINAVDLH